MARWRRNRRADKVPGGSHGGKRDGGRTRNVELAQRAVLFAARPQQVDVTQYRVSTVTAHGHGAAEVAPNPAIRSTSEQVEALIQDAANMLTVDTASWTQKKDRIHVSHALVDRLRDLLKVNVSDTKKIETLSLVCTRHTHTHNKCRSQRCHLLWNKGTWCGVTFTNDVSRSQRSVRKG